MSDHVDDPRTTFLKSLPRKIVEIKATLGALIADPRSSRMRDELRRRLHALLALARSYNLQGLSDALRSAEEILDATRSAPSLNASDIDRLTSFIASLSTRADRDMQITAVPESQLASMTLRGLTAPTSSPPGTVRASIPPPPGTRSDLPPTTFSRKTSSRPPASHSLSLPPAALSSALSVLFVGSHVLAATLRSVLPSDMELLPAENLSDALSLARDTAPDVIVAEVDPPADGASLLTALRADPLTDFLPVILLARAEEVVEATRERCPDASEVLAVSSDVIVLRAALERVLSTASLSAPQPDLGELTLDELSRALADEIRRGLVGAASPRSRGAKLSLGTGNEVLSATWEAIARIREVLEKQSRGAVRFELTATPRGLPGTHVFSMGDVAFDQDPQAPLEDPLPGRKALVVDDDPEVVKSFSTLLTQAGMTVIQRLDGASALIAARETHPDVVISDILMPGIDGFGLCRAIHRDVSLRHTPVILLSWKEDLLTRMRELGAQAQGYLRKESPGDAVLARVRSVLRARVRILRRVAEVSSSGTVRGRIERVGAFPLVEEAAKALENATITLADASSMTELEIRAGRLVAAVRTAQDGGLVRGESALLQALGLHTGRFAVRRNSASSRINLIGEIADLLRQSAQRISALEESVSGAALLDVASVEMEPESAAAYARSLTPSLRDVALALLAGTSPRDLVDRNQIDLSALEALLLELVRRGAVHRVLGARGEDLGAMRLATPPVAHSLPTEVALAPSDRPETPAPPPPSEPAPAELPSAPVLPPSVTPGRPDWLLPVAAALDSEPPPPSAPPTLSEEIIHTRRGTTEPDSLAAAVWRELRGVVDEHRPSSAESHKLAGLESRKGFSLGDFDFPGASHIARKEPAPLTALAPMGDAAMASISDVSLSEVQLAITPVENAALRAQEPDAHSVPPPAVPPAVPPPSIRPLAEPDEPSEPVPLLRQKLPVTVRMTAWEADTTPESSGDPSAETYEFKSFPPPPVGTRVAAVISTPPSGVTTAPREDEDELALLALVQASPLNSEAPAALTAEAPAALISEAPAALTSEAPAALVAEAPTAPTSEAPAETLQKTLSTLPEVMEEIKTETSPEPARLAGPSTQPPPPPEPVRPVDRTETVPAPAPVGPRIEDPTTESPARVAYNPRKTLKPLTPPPEAPALTSPTNQYSWLRLGLYVVLTFAASYLAVRWYVQQQPSVAPEPVLDAPPDAQPVTPATDASTAPGVGEDAGVDAANTARVTDDGGASPYVDPAPWLDGGALPAHTGLLVVRAQRRGASPVEVQVDQRVIGSAPVALPLSEGLHTVRFRAGIITSYQFATVRASSAVVLDAPSDH